VTHERDIAEYAMRIVSFLDGRVRADSQVSARRTAVLDLRAFPVETASAAMTR
jgi:hypothetical protein